MRKPGSVHERSFSHDHKNVKFLLKRTAEQGKSQKMGLGKLLIKVCHLILIVYSILIFLNTILNTNVPLHTVP